MSNRSRVVLVVFLVLLVAELGAAGYAGVVAWRARRPWRTFRVPPLLTHDWNHGLLADGVGGEVSFVGSGRLVVAMPSDDTIPDVPAQVWSVETGTLERTVERFPYSLDAYSGRALVLVGPDRSLELVDLATGETLPLSDLGRGASALALNTEEVATLVSFSSVALRSTRDGSLLRSVTVPESAQRPGPFTCIPSIVVSLEGDRFAITSASCRVCVCDLATERWYDAGVGEPVGFTAKGVLMVPNEAGRPGVLTLVGQGGSRRNVVPEESAVFHCLALSASGERVAYLHAITGTEAFEIVVATTDTGDVLKRVPVAKEHTLRPFALSPDGERLAVVDTDGLVEVWEIPGP